MRKLRMRIWVLLRDSTSLLTLSPSKGELAEEGS
jgi:hypothetical protein